MTQETHSCDLFCERPECIKTQRDDLRQKYFDLCDIQANSLKAAQQLHKWEVEGAVSEFKERIAEKIEKMPFGDTAASFAQWVRDQA